MFRVVTPPIIRSTYNCTAYGTGQTVPAAFLAEVSHSVSNLTTISVIVQQDATLLPSVRKVAKTVWPVPDAVITVICAPDDGWSYHPKHVVEQFKKI